MIKEPEYSLALSLNPLLNERGILQIGDPSIQIDQLFDR